MSEEVKRERMTLRMRITKKVNELDRIKKNLSTAELQANVDLLSDFLSSLKVLDNKILTDSRGDKNVSQSELERMEEACDEYLMKAMVCINEMKELLKGMANSNSAQGSATAPNRTRMDLPKLQLPEYWANEKKDGVTCIRFFEIFEHLLDSYNLNDLEMFNLLERQCQGRAKAMISSLHVSKQTYAQAKTILINSFAEEMPQKFSLIRELSELRFEWGTDDPFIFYSKFQKIIDSVKDNKVDIDTFLLYFIWNGLPSEFQDILVSITNKSYPDLKEVTSKFLDASNRYLKRLEDKQFDIKVTKLATTLNTSTGNSFRWDSKCILCLAMNHKIAKCTMYSDAKQKLERLKELKRCFKCLKENHVSKNCKFVSTGNCIKCGRGKHWSFLCTFEVSSSPSKPKLLVDKSSVFGAKAKKLVSSNSQGEKNDKAVTTNLSAISSQLDITDSLLPLLTVFAYVGDCRYEVDTVLDVGSQNSFLLAELAERLGLEVTNPHIPLLVKGINATQKVITKSVKFPLRIGSKVYTIDCICIPSINICFKTPNMNSLIDRLKSNGHLLAYRKFDGLSKLGEVNNIQLLIGARDWSIVNEMKSGVVGQDNRLTAYYEIPNGLILVGSISDWIKNCNYLKQSIDEKDSDSLDFSKTLVGVIQTEGMDLLESSESVSDTHVNKIECIDELVCDDILDLASYAELDKECDLLLNVDTENAVRAENTDLEKEVTDFILETSYRDENGRHVMAIPWLSRYKESLGCNERLAFKVLQSVRKKYEGKVDALARVDEVFKSQIDSGIIERIEDFDSFRQEYPMYSFLSHFPLIKEERETTKVRIVYMANLSEKQADGRKGLSLNQCMHPGYNKNLKIADALTLLRLDRYILTFDISKAFHRLGISEENSSKFLFYWFKNVTKGDFTPVVYKCNRVIFGMSVSPYLLQCALYKFLVMENDGDEELRDLGLRIYQGGYVDNFSVGCTKEHELKVIHDNAVKIFNDNQFPLQQFTTNSLEFQNQLDSIHCQDTARDVKILGMHWDRENDVLKAPYFKLNLEASTARQVISSLKGAYDLQNANLPALNRCKLFLRELQCDQNLKWDDILSNSRLQKWKTIVRQFNQYEPLEIPRFIGNRDSSYSMILMCDASKDFIGVVIYFRENETGRVSYISAHNKILDRVLRGRTMPVLEFSAIEFAVQKGLELYETFTSCLIPLNISEVMLFTDSTIALNWLAKSEYLENKMQSRSIYLNNRIEKIVNLCKKVQEVKFAHVGTSENAADLVTRMISPKKLRESCLISGPKFLQGDLSMHEWVTIPNPRVNNDPDLPKFSLNKVEFVKDGHALCKLMDLEKFSSLKKAVRVLKWVKLFVNNLISRLKSKSQKFSNLKIIPDSYKDCELDILKVSQREEFPEIFEYFECKTKYKMKIPTLVSQMNIVVDKDGLLKVKSKMGKLSKGNITRTPILLKKDSVFTKLLVMDVHRQFNHSGTYYILHQLKPKYFILKAFSAVKQIIGHCFHCKRFNSRPIKVNANDFKEWNIDPMQRFFSHCFVDYFGPYFTWYGKEKVKTYGVIFKCVWSKMINVEVVTSADTNNFLMAFQNHVYSYGLPRKLIADAGSNLSTAFSWIRSSLNTVEVKEYLDQSGVEYCDLEQYPKGSLNRGIGGIIESGVALIRKLIQGAIRNNVIEFQQFCHVIKQCICYANKRPLTTEPLREQNTDDEFQVVSPEFLKFGYETSVLEVGTSCNNFDDWEVDEKATDLVKLRKVMDIKERLRNNYHSEFLYGLMDQATRLKGKYYPVEHQNLSNGDIVLIKDSFVKAPNFPLAKVIEVTKNSLGEVTQAVLMKGNRSIVKRDVSSLILLLKNEQPTQTNGSESKNESCILNSRETSKRQAAMKSREKTRQMIEVADV